jgi:hypothetical protein
MVPSRRGGEFVVAGVDTAEVLEPTEHPLNEVAWSSGPGA